MTSLRPDWYGLGMTGVEVDALGDVATYDLNSNGLATIAIDPAQPDHQLQLTTHTGTSPRSD